MLLALQLENFRSFADSGRIDLSDLNVLIGPNSAGKSNVMMAIELALRGTSGSQKPLALDDIPSFASFTSVLRRNGSAKVRRPAEIALTMEVSEDGGQPEPARVRRYVIRESPASGAAFVHRVECGSAGAPDRWVVEAKDVDGTDYRVVSPADKADWAVSFMGGEMIFSARSQAGSIGPKTMRHTSALLAHPRKTIVVRPHRPVPRSVYVLDDPLMSTDDRELIKDLLRVWSAEDGKGARERIVDGLRTMTLASDIEVRAVARGQGAQMAEVRVTPQAKGRSVTLADVGYGVSQVLPLLSQDAQSTGSNLLVYQPEAHLHPLAQSRLADVFVASVKRGNRAYVETHSEHLVLRLQALIAGGEIAPERVRVFCVEHDGKRSNVYPMVFDERGVPKTPWPKGFLDTGLDLARDLAERRRRRTDG
jgi:AAA ATPase domain